MNNTTLAGLNDRFSIPEHITFKAGPGGLPLVQVDNAHAAAEISLLGAHVLAFQPHGHKPLIWLSESSFFEIGKSIRGGIPVCWPWFANHATDSTKPSHGFVRTLLWQVGATEIGDGGSSRLQLRLAHNDETMALWPHPFELELWVTVGPSMTVELVARNVGREPMTCSGALHTYFSIGDIAQIAIEGLDTALYLDKVDNFERKIQSDRLPLSRKTDRVFLDTTATCLIIDPQWQRNIRIAKEGSRSTVVWNPWSEKAKQMADFGDQDFRTMVCVETANAADDAVIIQPGAEHRLAAVISTVSHQRPRRLICLILN